MTILTGCDSEMLNFRLRGPCLCSHHQRLVHISILRYSSKIRIVSLGIDPGYIRLPQSEK
jgi:hypothetical protein